MSEHEFRKELIDIMNWQKDHGERDAKRFQELTDVLAEINKKLEPLSDTFTTAKMLSKWGKAGLILLSVIIGIILGVKNILK